jgi:hypothetical protein
VIGVRTFVRESSLSLVFLLLFLGSLAGQAFAGWHQFNNQQVGEQLGRVTFLEYLSSAEFVADVAENWQSEYLQFFFFIFATVWLVQRGSPESKELDRVGRESDEDQKVGKYAEKRSPAWARASGWRRSLYSSSLLLVMGTIFLLSWAVQSVAGWIAFGEERLRNLQEPISWAAYVTNADFWSRTLQNWQSEFLAVGSMAVLAIYLRERGSPESKPVGAPHDTTGVEG